MTINSVGYSRYARAAYRRSLVTPRPPWWRKPLVDTLIGLWGAVVILMGYAIWTGLRDLAGALGWL